MNYEQVENEITNSIKSMNVNHEFSMHICQNIMKNIKNGALTGNIYIKMSDFEHTMEYINRVMFFVKKVFAKNGYILVYGVTNDISKLLEPEYYISYKLV